MEFAFRWCLGILVISAFQVGCCRIELHGGPSRSMLSAPAIAHASHGPHAVAGGTCADGDCCATSSSWDGESCGLNGLDPLFNGSLHSNWKSKFSRCGSTIACTGACGEVYWDEHINEPPVCDPCGAQGAWVGANCGACRPWFSRMRDLWGYRYESPDCSGCSACVVGGLPTRWAVERGMTSGECARCDTGVETQLQPSEVVVPSQMVPNSPTPVQPKVAPTPEVQARRRVSNSVGSVAVSDSMPRASSKPGSMSPKSRAPSQRVASKQAPSAPSASAPVAQDFDGIPRQLQVQTVNGQKRLVARGQGKD